MADVDPRQAYQALLLFIEQNDHTFPLSAEARAVLGVARAALAQSEAKVPVAEPEEPAEPKGKGKRG